MIRDVWFATLCVAFLRIKITSVFKVKRRKIETYYLAKYKVIDRENEMIINYTHIFPFIQKYRAFKWKDVLCVLFVCHADNQRCEYFLRNSSHLFTFDGAGFFFVESYLGLNRVFYGICD
jgi:cupin superfamily acireductone dioxygenase involved in methionine salvage